MHGEPGKLTFKSCVSFFLIMELIIQTMNEPIIQTLDGGHN